MPRALALLAALPALLAACGGGALVFEGLESPRGLTPHDGGLLVAEVASGAITRLEPDGSRSVVLDLLPTLANGPEGAPAGPSAVIPDGDGGLLFAVSEARAKGFREVYRWRPGEHPMGITGQELLAVSPPNPLLNPYDLAPAPGGGLFVSDAGANVIWRVSPDGELALYADFPPLDNPTGEGPSEMDAVPTGLALGPDGALYAAMLTGFPYPTGAALVHRLEDVNGDGDALDAGEMSVAARGLTAATDVAFDADGAMLVTEFSADMRALVELGYAEAAQAPGRLVRVRPDGGLDALADDLVSPTAVAVLDGRIFVSEEFAGRVREIPPPRR
ncbi:MAG: ScyD/ScyE family protein [Chloroflexota bacterium]|nr:ScyD/ScyE family protein [Chloroflexota bacterium]